MVYNARAATSLEETYSTRMSAKVHKDYTQGVSI